jgi:hypothetical protein
MKAYKGGKSSSEPGNNDRDLLRIIQQQQKGGQNSVTSESGKKYSQMLLELIKPFHPPVPDVDDVEWLLDLASIAWNIANMKKLVPHAFNTMLEETKNDFDDDKASIEILEKLIKAKEKKFGKEYMFIQNVDVNFQNEQCNVTVTAIPLESFLLNTMEEEEEEMESAEEDNFEPGYINRNAFSIVLRQPFLNWVKETEKNSLFPREATDTNIYLLEEKNDNAEIENWIKKNFDLVFKKELAAWFADEKLWPKNRSYKMFTEWFTVSYHSMVYDLENFPVDKDAE